MRVNVLRARLLFGAVAAVLLGMVAPAAADEEKPKKLVPSPAAREMIERQGFAVDPTVQTSLSGVYRFPKGSVFVTTDAGLASYLVLLRRVGFHLGGGWDAEALTHLHAWRQALGTQESPGAATFFVDLLLGLHGQGPSDASDVTAEIARLKQGDVAVPFPRLGTSLDRRPAELWVGDYLGGEVRWQVLVYLLTRVRFSEDPAGIAAREVLQRTMPKKLRETVAHYVTWAGASRVGFPGARGVFDFHVLGDQRFPPGTLTASVDLPAYVVGAELGNAEARRRLAKAPLSSLVVERAEDPESGTLRSGLDGVLRTLAEKPKSVPPLFRRPAWSALELQTILATNVLFDRAIGVATGPWDVFGLSEHPGFVDPNPAFWRALAALAAETAKEARRLGILDHEVPSLADIDRVERAVEPRLKAEEPFTDEEAHLLIRCGLDGWSSGMILQFGRDPYLEKTEEERKAWRERIRRTLYPEREDRRIFDWARKAAASRGVPVAVGRLERLAGILETMADTAENQLTRTPPKDLAERLQAFGRLVHEIFSGYAQADPLCTCVPRLRDPAAGTLFQGVAGLDTLWLRYPWEDGHVLCRGAVFSYRELVSRSWITEADWRARVRGTRAPPRPAWSKPLFGRPPHER